MSRTAEVVYVGNPDDLIRAHERIKASNASTTREVEAGGKRISSSYLSAAGASKKAAAEIEASGGRIGSSLVGIGRSSNLAVAGVVAVGAAVEGIKHSAGTLAEIADETRKLHNVTGLNTKAASAYAAVAKAQDLPVKALNQAFGTLSKNIHAVENAHSGATKAAKTQENALRQLGLPMASITKAHGDLNKLLPEIVTRFEHLPGSVNKAAIGMALFGRGWQTLVPLMHKGALGIKEQLDEAEKMGATLSGSSAQKLKEFAKQQEEAKYASLGLQFAIGQYVAPALTKMIHALADAAHALGEGVHWLEKHEDAAKAAAVVIGTVLGGALTVFAYTKAKKFVDATKDMIGAISSLASKVGLSSKEVTGSFASQSAAAEAAAAKTAGTEGALAAKVEGADAQIVEANRVAGASYGKLATSAEAAAARVSSPSLLGKLGKFAKLAGEVYLAIEGTKIGVNIEEELIGGHVNELLGGNQPGEQYKEGSEGLKYGRKWDEQHSRSNTEGGIMAYFMSKGLSAAQAAGIVGNFQQESGLNPNAPGGGLDQGQGSRAHGGSTKQQIEAIWKELESGEKATLAALKAAKSPQEAARIFSERFERPGKPMLSNRERYAEEAYKRHPQHHAAKAHEEGGNLGYFTAGEKTEKKSEGFNQDTGEIEWHTAAEWRHIHAVHARNVAAGKGRASATQIDKWAEEKVGKFEESWGKNTGPELDHLEKQFGMRVQEWCAMFATTAAAMGGASKAVKTASVATIHEWAEAGTHGYKKGVSKTPHVGDLMMFGDSHVGFVQSVHGSEVTTIEGNTSGGKVEVEHRKVSEGDFASPIYHKNGGAGSVIREAESAKLNAEFEKELKLELTAAKKAQLHSFVAAAGRAHGEREFHEGVISTNRAFLTSRQARWALEKPDLTTAEGQKVAKERDQTAVLVAQSEKKEQQRELKEIQAEAANWKKVRDSYRHIARRAHGNAKKEAIEKVAKYDAKFKQAQIDANAMKGSIADTETAILEAQNVVDVVLPEEIAQAAQTAAQKVAEGQANNLSAYEAANSKIDAELRADLITEDQAKAAKIRNAEKAEAHGYGELSEEGLLKVKGDLKEFSEAVTKATSALEDHTKALEENAKALKEFNQESQGIAAIESGVLAKGLADLISGQIGGRPQVVGAGRGSASGSAARY